MKNFQEEMDNAIKSMGKVEKYLLSLVDEKTLNNIKSELEKLFKENSSEEWKNLVITQLNSYDSNVSSGMPNDIARTLFYNSIKDWVKLYGGKKTEK